MKVFTRYQLIAATLLILSIFLLPATNAGNQRSESRGNGSLLAGVFDDPVADLGVDKSAPDQAAAGSDFTYTITVDNFGPDAADNANLSDPLPASLTFVSLSTPLGWTCMTPSVGAGGTITCTNPSMAAAAEDVFMLVVHVPSDALPGTFFTNTATVSTTTLDPNDENNSSSAATLLSGSPSADMTVSKSVDSSEVPAGATLTYTIQVTNAGPDSADNATMDDPLPPDTAFYSLAQPPGWTCTTPAMQTNGTVSCSRPNLPASGSDTFTLVVYVLSGTPPATVIINTATVSTSTAETGTENNSDNASSTVAQPTAAGGTISGSIVDDQGNPVAGTVVRLNGPLSRKTITDANGNYQFDNVDTGAFYTVTPSRANFNFNPFNRSFSQVGNKTEATFTGTSRGDNTNPLDTPEYFVRQEYVDMLGREPDEAGFNFWSDKINQCLSEPPAVAGGSTNAAACLSTQRINVAAAFFMAAEFQQTGSYLYDVYAGALGRKPAYAEYAADRQQIIGGAALETEKVAFAQSFVQRSEFTAKYQNALTAEAFVEALIQSVQAAGLNLAGERDNLIGAYNSGADIIQSRAAVVRTMADNATFKQAQYNQAFVLTEYFGYLRRDPDRGGNDFWLSVLNTGGNYRGLVCSFITSAEYQHRFSQVVSRSNGECAQ